MNVQELIDHLTLLEKAALLSGSSEWTSRKIDRLNIPSLFCSDGPNGLRKQEGAGDHLGLNASVKATCFPTSATIANSFDDALAEKTGTALGEEAAAHEVNVVLGPGLNIKRSPLCGRNFEYFSEDPYLSGKMAAGFVRGVQKNGISACVKHFAANSQESRRMAMNSVVDERTLREIYLTGFEIAVKEGHPGAVMSSYNMLNGAYANENHHLLMDILRQDFGFDGAVITDWGGSNDHVEGVRNGSTLEMPNPGLASTREIVRAVKKGKLSEADVDARVKELLELVFRTKSGLDNFKNTYGSMEDMLKAHHQVARDAAAQSAVLLRNEDGILPLKKGTKVAIIGDFAAKPRYQGAGSSLVNSYLVDPVTELLKKDDHGLEVVGFAQGYLREDKEDDVLSKEACELAKKADVVLFFFGLTENSESEGLDRQHLRIPQNQIRLIQMLSMANRNLVGIISAGSAIEMPWRMHFRALLHMYLMGDGGSGACLDLLTGRANPSGKLAETIPMAYEDSPSAPYYPAQERNAEYREGLYVGYRYFATTGTKTCYPFGYGLSYTTFAYTDLMVDKKGVSFEITNTGSVDGAEVAELYIGLPGGKIYRPVRELKGYVKVFLKAGETRRVSIPFNDYTFRYWNTRTNTWEVEEGDYSVEIGASSEDIRLTGRVHEKGTGAQVPAEYESLPDYFTGHIENVPDAEYEKLLGTPIPDGHWGGKLTKNDALCQLYYAKGAIFRAIYKALHSSVENSLKSGVPNLNALFQYNMPFRAMAKMTGGMVNMTMVNGMVDGANGNPFKCIGKLVGGFFGNLVANLVTSIQLSHQKG